MSASSWPWQTHVAAAERLAEPHPDPFSQIVVRLPTPAARIVGQAFDRYYANHAPPASVAVAWGMFLEALAADYLAGPDPEGW